MGKHRIDQHNDQMWNAATLATAAARLPRHSSADEDVTAPLPTVGGGGAGVGAGVPPTAAAD